MLGGGGGAMAEAGDEGPGRTVAEGIGGRAGLSVPRDEQPIVGSAAQQNKTMAPGLGT